MDEVQNIVLFNSAAVAEAMFHNLRGDGVATPHEQLADREFQVMRLIASGKSNMEIADELVLSPKTFSTHKARILEKMNMGNQAKLIRYAIEHKLVDTSNSGGGTWDARGDAGQASIASRV